MKRRAFVGGLASLVGSARAVSAAVFRFSRSGSVGSGGTGVVPTSIRGTSYPFMDQANGSTCQAGPGYASIVSGTFNLTAQGGWYYGYGGTTSPATFTAQWMLDDTPVGPILTASNQPNVYLPPSFTLSFNSTLYPDGTHILWLKFLDHTIDVVYYYHCSGHALIINNHGLNNGAQRIAVSPNIAVRSVFPARPEYYNYPGGPLINNAFPWPYSPAPSAGGVAKPYFIEDLTGPVTSEYQGDPVLTTFPLGGGIDGGLWVQSMTVENNGGTNNTAAYFNTIGLNPSDGGRCVNLTSAEATVIEDPTGSCWWVAENQGRLFRLDHDGTVTTVAGYTKDRSKPSYQQSMGLDPANEALLRTRQVLIGTFDPDVDLGNATDLCFDPRDSAHKTIYIVSQIDNRILKVDMSVSPAHVSLYAGALNGAYGYVDHATATSARFNNPSSIIMTDGVHGPDPIGVMYVCDTLNCAIRKIASPSMGVAGAVTTFLGNSTAVLPTANQVASQPDFYSPPTGTLPFASFNAATPTAWITYPFTIRFSSSGDIIVFEQIMYHVRHIWLSGANIGNVTSIGYATGHDWAVAHTNGGFAWGWIDVDTAGTFGVVDDIYIAQVMSVDGNAEDYYHLAIDGTQGYGIGGGFGIAPRCAGYGGYYYHGWGHYPWTIAISRYEGRMIVGGVSDRGLRCVKVAGPNDPYIPPPEGLSQGTAANIHFSAYLAGNYIWLQGSVGGRGANNNGWPGALRDNIVVEAFPWNSRPPFTALFGNCGSGYLGIPGCGSFDEMCAGKSDTQLAAFIQSGMGGIATPRPEVSGNDMRDLIYFIRRNTIAGATDNGGNAVQPGADHPDTGNYPTILNISATRDLVNHTLTVNWTTDKPTIGFAGCGSTAQLNGGIYAVPYPICSDIETPISFSPLTYRTTHSATIISVPNTITPLHYTAIAKDLAGNSVRASDQVIT